MAFKLFNVRECLSNPKLCCVQFDLFPNNLLVSLTRPLLSFQSSDDDAANTPLAQLLAIRQKKRVPGRNMTKTGSTAAGAMGEKGDMNEQVSGRLMVRPSFSKTSYATSSVQ
jgi:hypothetical protein